MLCLRLCFAVAAAFGSVLAANAAGAAAPGFYEAESDVVDQSAAARRRAAQQGLGEVLIRMSGTAPLPSAPALREALRQPQRYYDRFLFVADDRLKLFFTPSALLDLIDRAKLPLWPRRRPPAIAWLALAQGGPRVIVRGGHPLAAALVEQARRRGVEVRLPLMDLRDQLRVQPAAVWGRASLVVAEASRRYGAEDVLIGRLRSDGLGGWSADFAYWQAGNEFTRQVSGPDLAQVGAAGADFLANAIASRDALPWRPTQPRALVVGGIASPLHYGSLLRYLSGLAYLKDVAVVGLNQDRLDIQVASRAEMDRLLALLQMDDRLAGAVPGAPANQLTWRGETWDRPQAVRPLPTRPLAPRSGGAVRRALDDPNQPARTP